MRIESIDISNFKGIEKFSAGGLAKEPVVMLSGRNGTGKSLVLEAVLALWMNRYSWAERVGPWSDQCSVSIEVEFDSSEMSRLHEWALQSRMATVDLTRNRAVARLCVHRTGNVTENFADGAIAVARNSEFQRREHFTGIDYISADRSVPLSGKPAVDLSVLDHEQVSNQRISMLDQSINNRTGMNLPHIATFLATLDYQTFLAERQNIVIEDEYARLADAFNRATGKNLRKPDYDRFSGSTIRIELPSGATHELQGLSSGEQEMLALLCLVRRLSYAGGVLCVDEPEQHLHPTLQATLFESIKDLSARAQVIVVSHSVNLISTAPLTAIFDVGAPLGDGSNQARPLTNAPDRTRLIAQLGVTAASLLQSDMLLVVEGDDDAKRLHRMFPVEAGRIQFVVAGGGDRVIQMHDSLAAVSLGIPWLCIRDRDFLSLSSIGSLRNSRPSLMIWPRRELENHLLDPVLIADVLNVIGGNVTAAEVEEVLWALAEPLVSETVAEFASAAVLTMFPAPSVPRGALTRKLRIEEEFRQYAIVNTDRANALNSVWDITESDVKSRWNRDWHALVDAKIVLRQFALRHSPFATDGEFVDALCGRVAVNPSAGPAAVMDLRRLILNRMNSG